jgi:hypothetical protein
LIVFLCDLTPFLAHWIVITPNLAKKNGKNKKIKKVHIDFGIHPRKLNTLIKTK